MGNVAAEGLVAERLRRLARSAKESARVADEDRESRNAAIGEADAAGWGLREIARWTSMSPSHVQRIVIEQTKAAQEGDPDPEVHPS